MNKRSPDENIVLGICLICLIGLVPFVGIRLIRGDLLVAAVDFIGVLSCGYCFRRVQKTGSIAYIGPFLAILSLAGMTLNIVMLGSRDLYFFYPVAIASFFLMSPKHALMATMVAAITVVSVILPSVGGFESAKFLLSLVGTSLFAFTFAWQRNRQSEQLHLQSRADSLTGAGNRRALREQLDHLIALHERDKQPMSLIILDLDDFKTINDQQGHLAGDKVLIQLTALIVERIRATDYLYRYGGDEFMILANHSDLDATQVLAEELRQRIQESSELASHALSVSMGISQYKLGESADHWLARADHAMYSAKDGGKNAVGVADVSESNIFLRP